MLEQFTDRLQSALTFGKQAGELKRDAEAEALWRTVYGFLKRSGDTIPHTDRARPYVVRLSLLYALADQSAVIRVEHLRAALAAWDYCRASAALLFGSGTCPAPTLEPLPLADKLLSLLKDNPEGMSITELHEATGKRFKAEERDAALAQLDAEGKAHWRRIGTSTKPKEVWLYGKWQKDDTVRKKKTDPSKADASTVQSAPQDRTIALSATPEAEAEIMRKCESAESTSTKPEPKAIVRKCDYAEAKAGAGKDYSSSLGVISPAPAPDEMTPDEFDDCLRRELDEVDRQRLMP